MHNRLAGSIVSPRTNTIWALPRAASVGKSFALLNANPEPTVKKLKKKRTTSETTTGPSSFRMSKYRRSYQRPDRGPYESTRREHVKVAGLGTVRLTSTNPMSRFIRFVCITRKVQTSLKVMKTNKRVIKGQTDHVNKGIVQIPGPANPITISPLLDSPQIRSA